MGKLHYFDLYFIYYLAASYAMTYQTNFNSLSGSSISREILDLKKIGINGNMNFFYSETIYVRIIKDKLDKKECEISNKIEL